MNIDVFKLLEQEVSNLEANIGRLRQILENIEVGFEPPTIEQKELKYN
jgi:hypothetical protein